MDSVALWSEDGPPADVADRLSLSTPLLAMAGIFHRIFKVIGELDRYVDRICLLLVDALG